MIARFPLGPLVGAGLVVIVGTSVSAEGVRPKVTVDPPKLKVTVSPAAACRSITGDLLKEAKRRIERFDIACAREILLAPEAATSAAMVFLLAETYDPHMLAAWQTRGMGNTEKAKALYEKARDLGHPEAQLRLDRLRTWP